MMPMGGLDAVVDRYALDTIVLRRFDVAIRDFADRDAQTALVDPFPSGALQALGEGVTGQAGSVPIYWREDADVEVGDTFAIGGDEYRIGWVGPPGRMPAKATTFVVLSFAVARRARGEA